MKNSKILPSVYRILFLLIIPLITIVNARLNRDNGDVHIIKTFIDDAIPFYKIFIIPYLFWFVYFVGILLYFAILDGKKYFRLLMSIVIGNLSCYLFYYFYQSTVPRPVVVGNDFLSWLVRLTYSGDNPFNCFPSIHVLNALICALFLYKYNNRIFVRVFAWIGCIMISISTLYVKQHYTPDIISSAILGTMMFVVFDNNYIWNVQPIRRFLTYLIPPRVKDYLLN